MEDCNPNTLPIESQILTGMITQVALANDFGKIQLGSIEFAYFNFNNQYGSFNNNDTINFFFTEPQNVIIELSGNIITYPTDTNLVAFNLHLDKKALLGKDGKPRKRKGTNSDIPPSGLYSNIPGGANSKYFINDCGEVHLVKPNSNINNPWDRFEVAFVSSAHSPVNLYEYVGPTLDYWSL